MGTYLSIQLKNTKPECVNFFNGQVRDTFRKVVNPKSLQNFYGEPMRYVLRFNTNSDNIKWAKDLVKSDKYGHLGITKDTSTREAKKILIKTFPQWTEIGNAEIKISGGHYCYHILIAVRDFIDKWHKEFVVDGYDDLLDYIKYKEQVITSSYCRECEYIAKELNIALPLHSGDGCKNVTLGSLLGDGTGTDYDRALQKLETLENTV